MISFLYSAFFMYGACLLKSLMHVGLPSKFGWCIGTLKSINVWEMVRRFELHEKSGLRIGSVVIDCINFDEMLAFWQEALHYVPRKPAEGGWVVLRDPEGRGPNVSLNQVSKRLIGRNWLHFDLYTDDQEGEVKRLLKIGATRHRQAYDPGDDFRVLEDPDGNLFCVVDVGKR
jgi:catechol 2,3-dioxygenase-like lactoylglutathione lyase family enzyme